MRVRATFAIAFCAALFLGGIVVGLAIDVADNVIVRYERDVIATEANTSLTALLAKAENLELACSALLDASDAWVEEVRAPATPLPTPPRAIPRAPSVVEVHLAMDDIVEETLVEEEPSSQASPAVQPIQLPEDTRRPVRGPGAF